MISSIEISRFRGIREGKLEGLTPLVVLVGRNGCGKTSVLDALLVAASPETREGVGRAVVRHRGVRQGAPWLLWRKGVTGPCEITVKTAVGYERSCTLVPGPTLVRGSVIGCKVNDGDPQTSGNVTIAFTSENELDVSQHTVTLNPSSSLSRLPIVEGHQSDRDIPLHTLLTQAIEQGLTGHVMAIIAEAVPEAKELRIGIEDGMPLTYLIYEDHGVPLALAGDGICSLVRMTLQLVTHPCGTALLEEPETHQHPEAIRQAMRAVLAAVRRDIQVILTTHSLELIDALLAVSSAEDLEKLSLYKLELQDGRLISVRIPGPDVAFSRQEVEDDLR